MTTTKRYRRSYWDKLKYEDLAIAALGVVAIDISLNFSWASFACTALLMGVSVLGMVIVEKGFLHDRQISNFISRTDIRVTLGLVLYAIISIFYLEQAHAFLFNDEETAFVTYIGVELLPAGSSGLDPLVRDTAVSGLTIAARSLFFITRLIIIGSFGFNLYKAFSGGDEGEAKKKALQNGILTLIIAVMADMGGSLLMA